MKNDLKITPCGAKREMRRGRPCINKISSNGYGFAGRIWIEGKDGTLFGHGRVILLERIRQYGSITGAAKSLNMSYRHAWELVDAMSGQSQTPLVEKSTGGKGGGGAVVTEAGERAIKYFWDLNERFKDFLDQEMKEFRL